MRQFTYFLLTIALATICSCTNETAVGLDGLPKKYSYTVTMTCYCVQAYIGPHRLIIENGVVSDYQYLGEGEAMDENEYDQFALQSLQKKTEGGMTQNPATQVIERHPEYDFISSAYFDFDKQISDEEWGFRIEHFKAE